MRMLLQVNVPHDSFNAAIRDGSIGQKLDRILGDLKPEAVYFTEVDGQRCALLIVDMADSSQMPFYAEPWFLTFGADVRFRPVMTPEDLERAGLESLSKKWG